MHRNLLMHTQSAHVQGHLHSLQCGRQAYAGTRNLCALKQVSVKTAVCALEDSADLYVAMIS